MIKVTKKDGESADKLLRRFSGHVKSRKLPLKFRLLRYFKQKPTQKKVREIAISRETHRAANKKRQILS